MRTVVDQAAGAFLGACIIALNLGLAILGAAPALEVATPDAIGRICPGKRRSIRIHTPALLARDHQPFPPQQFADGAHRRPSPLAPLPFQKSFQFARSPAHMCVSQFHDLLLHVFGRLVGMALRRATALLQRLQPPPS